MLSELYRLFKLIWQKKKCCDYKLWKYFLQCSLIQVSNGSSNVQIHGFIQKWIVESFTQPLADSYKNGSSESFWVNHWVIHSSDQFKIILAAVARNCATALFWFHLDLFSFVKQKIFGNTVKNAIYSLLFIELLYKIMRVSNWLNWGELMLLLFVFVCFFVYADLTH